MCVVIVHHVLRACMVYDQGFVNVTGYILYGCVCVCAHACVCALTCVHARYAIMLCISGKQARLC